MDWSEKLIGKNLNRQICFLSSFAMLLVVIGHSDITDDFKELFIYKWVYGFHMPLFFFVSGFLFAYTTPKEKLGSLNLGTFFKKKLKRLLVPYLFFNTLYFLIKATLISPDQMQHPVELTFDSFLYYTFVNPIGYLWFLPSLIVIFLIAVPAFKMFAASNHERPLLVMLGVWGGVFYPIMPDLFEFKRP
ncbi:MAG: acyltransferase family protein [Prevotella sp.]|nr:acyltransferase family protein [Prevotella sp.]